MPFSVTLPDLDFLPTDSRHLFLSKNLLFDVVLKAFVGLIQLSFVLQTSNICLVTFKNITDLPVNDTRVIPIRYIDDSGEEERSSRNQFLADFIGDLLVLWQLDVRKNTNLFLGG